MGLFLTENHHLRGLAASFEPLVHRRNVVNLIFFYVGIALVGVHLNCLNWVHFLILVAGPPVTLIDCMVFVLPCLTVIRMFLSTISFLTQLGSGIICLQNLFL